ncbi:acyl carrier protein [Phocaeicola abscessus]|uniref:acyl carrier protein n=1 Tax=Phocaeicola abscessus TaxID=555313 RepID=UPI000385C014|nr:acyl carrier protein [Phocaeicola abscessus]EPT33908.1 phosphopantetheine attachment domain protein [Bacteroidetes bacterium oral taxon 272 str. F0290]
MEREEILATVESIFAKVLKKNDLKMNDETTANDVDGWDSMSNMIVIAEIERHFGIRLKLREIIKMKNVGALCDVIKEKTSR